MKNSNMNELIDNKDYQGIEKALSGHPNLANEGIPYDRVNTTKAHPLHRICNKVFTGKYTNEEAIAVATIFLEHGANINGNGLQENQDTPLTAAASLSADSLAIFYIEKGADVHHAGQHGGTALHWAAWCGRDKLVSRLIEEGAEINKRCIDFKATPLFWAVHGLKNGGTSSMVDYLKCMKLLIKAGADKNIPNKDGKTVLDLLNEEDLGLKKVFSDI